MYFINLSHIKFIQPSFAHRVFQLVLSNIPAVFTEFGCVLYLQIYWMQLLWIRRSVLASDISVGHTFSRHSSHMTFPSALWLAQKKLGLKCSDFVFFFKMNINFKTDIRHSLVGNASILFNLDLQLSFKTLLQHYSLVYYDLESPVYKSLLKWD